MVPNGVFSVISYLTENIASHLSVYYAQLGRKYTVAVTLYHIHRIGRSIIEYEVLLINPLNAELNPICYLLALIGAYHILHISRIRVN
jgi:hypothetical protein